VTDLACREFVLLDNKVPQTIDSCEFQEMPLELVILSDASHSLLPAVLARQKESVEVALSFAGPDDRVRRIEFASAISERAETSSGGAAPGHGHTALVDAIATAAMLPASPGRRRIAVVFSDGLDSFSILPKELVQSVVDRSDTVVHVFAVSATAGLWMSPWGDGTKPYFWFLSDLAARSGGHFRDVSPNRDLRAWIREAVEDARSRYLLRYVPRGVSDLGWHSLSVEVTRPGRHTVTARAGYHRGS
jgi:hypothetical protein